MAGWILQRRSYGLLLLAFFVLSFGNFGTLSHTASAAELSGAAPYLISASSSTITASNVGGIVVSGDAFTPGGAVYVALYDAWGERLYETRWATASVDLFGPDNSMDPALGYMPGGKILETFDHLCGGAVMVRAYDQQTGIWSNLIDASPTC